MLRSKISMVTTVFAGLLMLVAGNISNAVALTAIEDGCLDCHKKGSAIVPTARQFGNSTTWHNNHKGYAENNCDTCHDPVTFTPVPVGIGSRGNGCGNCHNTACTWQDFHENNQTYLATVVGYTCYQCHESCFTPVCGNGIIEAGEQCDDGNTFDGDCCTRTCQYERAGSPCPDAFYCNGQESCNGAGACQAGAVVDCSDGVECTDDVCDEITRACLHVPNNSKCANDGIFCNGIESCNPRSGCSSAGDPCLQGRVCNEDTGSCDPPPACGDGTLQPGEDCDDGNVLSGDCCSSLCTFEPAGSSCTDNQYCNGLETCNDSGLCQRGAPVDCSDGVACTLDSCDEVNDICMHLPDNSGCGDGIFCNGEEHCDPIMGCLAGTAVDCSDGVACTDDSCDEVTASCVHTPNNSRCPDDGIFCNGIEFCNLRNGCSSAGDPCLTGMVCIEGTRSCDARPTCGDGILDPGEDCDDGNMKDGDCCSSLCEREAVGSSCSDSLYCNGEETCNALGLCQQGDPVNCSDGVDCTIDSCDEVRDVCVNTPHDSNCPNDGLFCTGNEVCDPVKGCLSRGNPCASHQVCDEDNDQCLKTPECTSDADCDDDLFCNGSESCASEGACLRGISPCKQGETCNEENNRCEAAAIDLDIVSLRVTKRTQLIRDKQVIITLIVQNNGATDGAKGNAQITGLQNGVEVYRENLSVTGLAGKGRTVWAFPPYKPMHAGTIEWTATVDDSDPDIDSKTGETQVLP